jgi:2-keto-4-pentenoate hydratase/2-oxohepta-3-ene-1,7-dioic acid hydratase in catechol pathway
VSEADALGHVAGYACFVDASVRDYQKFSVTSGKNFPATGPLGPVMVTADEIGDPTRLTLVTRLNGQEMQRSGTDLLIYSIAQIIKFVSDFTSLAPGDIIATGTPAGVGHRRTPPVWMKPGDVLEVEISGIGTLRNPVVAE